MNRIPDFFPHTGTIQRIHTERFSLEAPFIDIAEKFADLEGTVVLMSGGGMDCARYHILAVHPWLTIQSHGATNRVILPGKEMAVAAGPLDLLKAIVAQYGLFNGNRPLDAPEAEIPGPVAAGLFGYLSYDLKDFIETLPRTTIDDLGMPLLCMYAPSAILVEDKTTGKRHLHIPVRKKGKGDTLDADRGAFFQGLETSLPAYPPDSPVFPAMGGAGFSTDSKGFASAFSRGTYMTAVDKIKDYIFSGHIYQVNLSQRFEGAFYGSSFCMFRTLFEKAPAPFYAYVNAGGHRIVSTSPERFVQRRGNRVETRPIKGTRPRGKSPAQDRNNAEALLKSAKDDAELSMIVDLLRNDLGRVCAGGSVRVVDHRRLEAYKNVFHLVSVIEGTLMEAKDSVDIIRAAFPGGSITGCPRIRAMEIIDEMEPCRRHIYTGSIGYIGFHDTMDLSIAIRTATVVGGRIYFSVGGGVVFDSDPADEYEETLHKGSSIMGLFEKAGRDGGGPETESTKAWYNGAIVPESDVRLAATDKGVQYGYGFFETIRVNRGVPNNLDAHAARLNNTWRALFDAPVPDLTWPAVIDSVVAANQLENTLARVKIMASCRDDGENAPFSANIVVTAGCARHRLDVLQKIGLDIAVYPHPRQTPLADHKTLNYLYYYLAGKWARQNGADEAVVLNPDGSVSETNTANILCIQGEKAVLPASDHVLPGIMQQQVAAYLSGKGFLLEKRKLMPADLSGFDAILLTNALMGAVPVIGVDGHPVRSDPGLCSRINAAVL
ncbi:MAG: aminodeoxychorismate synthase component I [Desulfosalsimonadaceae bacterium]